MARSLQPTPLVHSPADVAHLQARRAHALHRLHYHDEALPPAYAYALAYALEPDTSIVQALRVALERGPNVRRDRAGYIYVFTDSRDDADSRLVKIGVTVRDDPFTRIAEWNAELGANGHVTLLFAYRVYRFARFAETLIHTTLRAEHAPHRVAVRTQRELVEYFYAGADMLVSTRFLIKSIVTFINNAYQRPRHD